MGKVSLRVIENRYSKDCYASNGGWMTDCHIEAHPGEEVFGYNNEGIKIVTLHNYAIVPKDKYLKLLMEKSSVPIQKQSLWRRIMDRT